MLLGTGPPDFNCVALFNLSNKHTHTHSSGADRILATKAQLAVENRKTARLWLDIILRVCVCVCVCVIQLKQPACLTEEKSKTEKYTRFKTLEVWRGQRGVR